MSTRDVLITELRTRLEREDWPRCTMTAILAVAGLVSFVGSVMMLRAGVDSMAWRYGVSAVGGYLAFLLLMRLWIAVQRGWLPSGDIAPDVASEGLKAAADAPHALADAASLDIGDSGFGLDLDELFFVVLALLLVLGGVVAIVYVVYAAPLLLAEVALDAALVASVSARLRPHETQSWADGLVRRTLLPASALVLCVSLAGGIFSIAAPEAHSIGGVLRELLG